MLKKIALTCFSGIVFLASTEVALRLLFPHTTLPSQPKEWAVLPEESWTQYHPTLGWSHQTNKEAILKRRTSDIVIQTNSLGLRGNHEYVKEKPEGVLRVYALGDSFTFGFGVKDQESFPAQMEASDASMEIFNMGVCGYGVDQIFLYMKEFGWEYQPDVAFVTIYPEDFWRATRAFNDAGYSKPYFVLQSNGKLRLHPVPIPQGKDFSTPQFPDVLERGPLKKILHSSHVYVLGRRGFSHLQKLLGWIDPDSTTEWVLGRAILKATFEELKERNVRGILVVAPPRRWISGSVEPLRNSLLRFAKGESVEVVDLTVVLQDAVKREPIETFYIQDDWHWTALGNRLVAKTLLEHLKKPEP